MKKIITNHVYPPIPDRQFDWCAHFDGEEETRNYGWGCTEQDAIDDLLVNHGNAHVGEPLRSIINSFIGRTP